MDPRDYLKVTWEIQPQGGGAVNAGEEFALEISLENVSPYGDQFQQVVVSAQGTSHAQVGSYSEARLSMVLVEQDVATRRFPFTALGSFPHTSNHEGPVAFITVSANLLLGGDSYWSFTRRPVEVRAQILPQSDPD
jgi:hypothetical protein